MSKVVPDTGSSKPKAGEDEAKPEIKIDLDVDGTPFFQKPCCCNDFFYILLFVGFLVGLFTIWGIAGQRGDVRRLIYPMDIQGNLCGVANGKPETDFTNKKYLAWYDPQNWDSQICVEACRSNAAKLHSNISLSYFAASEIYDPKADHDKTYPRYDDVEILRRCQPKDMDNLPDDVKSVIENESYQAFYTDLDKSQWIMATMAAATVGLCLLYIWFLRYFACEMMWITAIGAILLLLAAGIFLVTKGSGKLSNDFNVSGSNTLLANAFGEKEQQSSLAIGIVILLFDLVFAIFIAWNRKKISLVGNMIEEAGLILMDVKSLFLFPLLPLVVSIGWFFIWLYCTMLIVSSGSMDVNTKDVFAVKKCDCPCDKPPRRIGEFDSTTKFCIFYSFVGLLWVESFFFAVCRATIASTASAWYFTRDKDTTEGKSDQLHTFIVGRSLLRTLRYNLGSLALGSLIIAITTIVKWFVDLCTAVAKRTEKSPSMQCFVAFVNCCIKAIALIIQYITKYAYIEIAMYGISFCDAAHRSAHLIEKNMAKIGVVDTVGDFLLFLCQTAISVTIAFVFYSVVMSEHYVDTYGALTHPKAMSIVCGAVAFTVTISFFGVMEAVIDTILVCFCEDVESNDPERGRPYYMSESLKKFIEQQENLMLQTQEKS